MPSEKPVRPLHTLAYGETAVITSMYLHGAIRQRLQDLGWITGTASAVCTPPAAEILPHTRFAAAWSPCESAMRK